MTDRQAIDLLDFIKEQLRKHRLTDVWRISEDWFHQYSDSFRDTNLSYNVLRLEKTLEYTIQLLEGSSRSTYYSALESINRFSDESTSRLSTILIQLPDDRTFNYADLPNYSDVLRELKELLNVIQG